MNLNKVFILGNLTRDPELKSLPSGTAVTNFAVATNRVWEDKDGKKQENVEFHNLVAMGRPAEVISTFLKKGDQVLVEGRLQTRSWESEGKKNYKTEIFVESFQLGGKRAEEKVETPNATSAKDEQLEEQQYPDF